MSEKARYPRYSRGCAILFASAIVLFVVLCFTTAGPFRSVSGKGCSAADANRRLWHCRVPPDASDVWFISAYRHTRVECTLEAESFKKWCHEKGWNPEAIHKERFVPSFRDIEGFRQIRQGLSFKDMNGDVGYWGYYDSENKRAYVQYSGG